MPARRIACGQSPGRRELKDEAALRTFGSAGKYFKHEGYSEHSDQAASECWWVEGQVEPTSRACELNADVVAPPTADSRDLVPASKQSGALTQLRAYLRLLHSVRHVGAKKARR